MYSVEKCVLFFFIFLPSFFLVSLFKKTLSFISNRFTELNLYHFLKYVGYQESVTFYHTHKNANYLPWTKNRFQSNFTISPFFLNALFTKTCRGWNPAFFLNEISTLHLYFPLLPKYKCTLSPLGFCYNHSNSRVSESHI